MKVQKSAKGTENTVLSVLSFLSFCKSGTIARIKKAVGVRVVVSEGVLHKKVTENTARKVVATSVHS